MSRGQGQSPIADKIADKLIQHYQTSSCQQLQQQKQQPPAGEKAAIERKIIETLHNDPELRKHFLDRLPAPSSTSYSSAALSLNGRLDEQKRKQSALARRERLWFFAGSYLGACAFSSAC